jgi:hypothetical protein
MDLGCKIRYKKSHLLEARPIRSPDDLRPGTKKGKLDRKPIWVVEIQMPKKVAFDMYKGYMQKMKNDYKEQAGPKESASPQGAPAPITPAAAAPPPVAGAAPTPAV